MVFPLEYSIFFLYLSTLWEQKMQFLLSIAYSEVIQLLTISKQEFD